MLQFGELIQLLVINDFIYIYNWSFVLGLSDIDILNFVVSLEEIIIYMLIIVDENGCFNIVEVLFFLFDLFCVVFYIFVLNVFSFNGDNLNDVLLVEGNVIDEFYLVIYDCWGEQVFELCLQVDGWDGIFQG